jgi:hypothetical protein
MPYKKITPLSINDPKCLANETQKFTTSFAISNKAVDNDMFPIMLVREKWYGFFPLFVEWNINAHALCLFCLLLTFISFAYFIAGY